MIKKKRLKIAYLNYENPKDKRAYSGSLYYMSQALQTHCGDVYYLDRIVPFEKRYIGRLIHETSRRFFKKNVAYDRLIFVAKKNAKIVAQRLAGLSFDVIVAPDGVPVVAFVETTIPIVIPLDVTFSLQQNYYPHYSHLTSWSAHQANILEHMAYNKARRLLFSSDWAAQSAIQDYAAEKWKVHVHAFGANLDHIPSKESILAKKQSGHCRLLFMGIGWERKGGEIAFETLRQLEQLGISAELIICGSTPPKNISHKSMTVIPYLDKNDEKQGKEIEKLYTMADFLLLPTRADCAPNVFKEANAFGLPVITTHTGGIPYIVRDGENGYLLPYDARGFWYAQIIADMYQDDQRYSALVRSSRAAYDERLNWDAWGMFVKNMLDEMLATEKSN